MASKRFSIKSIISSFRGAEKKRRIPHGKEIGVAGNTGHWGYANTGEYLRKLDGAAGRVIYDRMRRNDHQVKAVLGAITLPIRQADYYMEPGSEEKGDVEIAKILEKALLEEMTITWDDTVRHALLMLPFGFSALEKVYEYRDGLILPRKLDPRLPQSVTGSRSQNCSSLARKRKATIGRGCRFYDPRTKGGTSRTRWKKSTRSCTTAGARGSRR